MENGGFVEDFGSAWFKIISKTMLMVVGYGWVGTDWTLLIGHPNTLQEPFASRKNHLDACNPRHLNL